MRVRLCPAVHGHIADSVRDHEPGPGGRIALGEEAEEAVHRTAGSTVLRWPAVLGEGPARPGSSLVVDSLAHAQPAGSGGSRGDPADLGVSPWTVAELRCLAPWCFIALPRRAAGPCRPARAWPAECSDRPRMNRLPARRWLPLTSDGPAMYLRWTCHVPRATAPMMAIRSKRPVTCVVLMTPPVSARNLLMDLGDRIGSSASSSGTGMPGSPAPSTKSSLAKT